MFPTKKEKVLIEKIYNNWYSITVIGKREYNKLEKLLGEPSTYYYKSIKWYPDRCMAWSFVANNKQIEEVRNIFNK
jgi:superfamily II DNA or RNA helicase